MAKVIIGIHGLGNKPLDNKITDKDDPFYLNDKYFPSPKKFIIEEHPRRKIILDYYAFPFD